MADAMRASGVPVLGEIPWGAHICLFYETKDDLLDTLILYFKAGLESNEFCIWAVSEPATVDEAKSGLAQDIPGFADFLAEGAIEIIPGRDWYLAGSQFDLQRITGGWDEKLRAALAKGYDGMRVSGNAFWLASDHWKDFTAYEHELEKSLAGQPMIASCTYALSESRATDLLEVARAHDVTVARSNGVWEFIETATAELVTSPLTPREIEVLSWVAQGKSAWEIGAILGITKRTVDEHAQTATRKLGAANRTQAVAIAIRDRLIEKKPAA